MDDGASDKEDGAAVVAVAETDHVYSILSVIFVLYKFFTFIVLLSLVCSRK
jgi:hypothetical protein